MPIWKIDELIEFNEHFLWIYHSLHLLITIVVLRFKDKRNLFVFTIGVFLIAAISFLIFMLFPTSIVRPSTEGTSDFYKWFVTMDKSGNAFPSLHVSLAIFTTLSATIQKSTKKWSKYILWVWCLGIIYSTLATKQHVFLDVLGGLSLGIICYLVVRKLMGYFLPKT
jgi:membrane-associated phospholipid phosphatase